MGITLLSGLRHAGTAWLRVADPCPLRHRVSRNYIIITRFTIAYHYECYE